jgi:antitoxin HigA-1
MLDDERQTLKQAFESAEASLLIEGLTPSAHYASVKARVLSGEITYEQGRSEILASYDRPTHAVA